MVSVKWVWFWNVSILLKTEMCEKFVHYKCNKIYAYIYKPCIIKLSVWPIQSNNLHLQRTGLNTDRYSQSFCNWLFDSWLLQYLATEYPCCLKCMSNNNAIKSTFKNNVVECKFTNKNSKYQLS